MALAAGYHLAFRIGVGCLIAATMIAATVLQSAPPLEHTETGAGSTVA